MKIDIIVPTYNRPKDLEKFVTEIQKQTYKDFKVHIIDDCGDINIKHLIPQNNAKFHFERLAKNGGQANARNHALKKSNSEIVIFMDDDAWFLNSDALYEIVNYYKNNSSISCLMFDVQEPNRELLSKRNHLNDMQEIGEFIACGVSFRRKPLERIGGYSKSFHSYGEETELSMRLIDKGYKLFFGKRIKLFHNYIPKDRDIIWFKRFKFNTVRNDLMIVLMKYPLIYVFYYFPGKFFSHIIYNFKNEKNSFIANTVSFKALFFVIQHLFSIERAPMKIKNFRHWKEIRF